MSRCHETNPRRVGPISRHEGCWARYEAPEAAQCEQQGVAEGIGAALEAARRPEARQLPHEQPNVRFVPPPFVRLYGKGRRERLTPLLPQTARLVRRFLATAGRREDETAPLIENRNGQRLTRHGARYLLDKYVKCAQVSLPSLARVRISPHTFRYTKAMHLLQSDIPLVTIKDFLGHADVKSTEVRGRGERVAHRADQETPDDRARGAGTTAMTRLGMDVRR